MELGTPNLRNDALYASKDEAPTLMSALAKILLQWHDEAIGLDSLCS